MTAERVAMRNARRLSRKIFDDYDLLLNSLRVLTSSLPDYWTRLDEYGLAEELCHAHDISRARCSNVARFIIHHKSQILEAEHDDSGCVAWTFWERSSLFA